MTAPRDSLPCLANAWGAHAAELRGWLRRHLQAAEDAEDLLQEVFVKALKQGKGFCAIDQPRAWLFEVARNTLIDRQRAHREQLPLPDDIPALDDEGPAPVEQLSQCLPRVLSELAEADRLAIELCDIEGQPQQMLAERLGISLSGAKSRLQRARLRLRQRLEEACRVRFDQRGSVCCFTPRQNKS